MNKELIIDAGSAEVNIALLEDKDLVELNKEKSNNSFAVGDVYLGRVKKIMPGLNAAFIDVGFEKDAFLHYLDLGPQVNSLNKLLKLHLTGKPGLPGMAELIPEADIEKTGKINTVLTQNQPVLIQIAKDPSLPKGQGCRPKYHLPDDIWYWCPFQTGYPFRKKLKVLRNAIV